MRFWRYSKRTLDNLLATTVKLLCNLIPLNESLTHTFPANGRRMLDFHPRLGTKQLRLYFGLTKEAAV